MNKNILSPINIWKLSRCGNMNIKWASWSSWWYPHNPSIQRIAMSRYMIDPFWVWHGLYQRQVNRFVQDSKNAFVSKTSNVYLCAHIIDKLEPQIKIVQSILGPKIILRCGSWFCDGLCNVRPASFGCAQGAVLSPSLYNIYIYDASTPQNCVVELNAEGQRFFNKAGRLNG